MIVTLFSEEEESSHFINLSDPFCTSFNCSVVESRFLVSMAESVVCNSSIPSGLLDGDHQPTHGPNGIEELQTTDSAMDTRNLLSTTEQLKLVQNGSDKLMKWLDSSSSENKVTIIALHAHNHTLDTQPPELDTRNQRSIPIES
jgi:hypothetical protein